MARKKLSEYRAKTLLLEAAGEKYVGVAVGNDDFSAPKGDSFVIKVDEGVKGRFKKGLVLLDQPADKLEQGIQQLRSKGFTSFLIEKQLTHSADEERYFAIERERAGSTIRYSTAGGVDIESNPEKVKQTIITQASLPKVAQELGVQTGWLEQIVKAFESNYFSFLEVNPLVVKDGQPYILDAAVEVDGEAQFLVDSRWTDTDFRTYGSKTKTPEEVAVDELAAQSQASFSLEVLNPHGQIFLLLSGGGASVVVADEVNNRGLGEQLGNYGEYSGNPNTEETQIYTTQILSLLLKSTAKPKVLIIGGGVANFTDVRATFKGVLQAFEELKSQLKSQNIKVFVRRGGPFEKEGLDMMSSYLKSNELYGSVSGPEMTLTTVVTKAIAALKEAK